MKIMINNQAGIANKYLRFIKWKLYQAKKKFDNLSYVKIFITKEGKSKAVFKTVLKLGVPGNDIILSYQSEQPTQLWSKASSGVYRYLRKHKEKQQYKPQLI